MTGPGGSFGNNLKIWYYFAFDFEIRVEVDAGCAGGWIVMFGLRNAPLKGTAPGPDPKIGLGGGGVGCDIPNGIFVTGLSFTSFFFLFFFYLDLEGEEETELSDELDDDDDAEDDDDGDLYFLFSFFDLFLSLSRFFSFSFTFSFSLFFFDFFLRSLSLSRDFSFSRSLSFFFFLSPIGYYYKRVDAILDHKLKINIFWQAQAMPACWSFETRVWILLSLIFISCSIFCIFSSKIYVN